LRRLHRITSTTIALTVTLVFGALLALSPIDAAPAAAAPSGRVYGAGPYADILHWAGVYARPSCGLSQNRLAAMMMVPTFPETGAGTTTAPGPMTLSRWDTQSALWAFGDKDTPYQRAFWHPGVGMWQFDSAGGWNLTAGTAIDVATSAPVAAQVMSSRFCASTSPDVVEKMRSGWFPWFECHSGPLCTDLLDSIFDGTNLFVTLDASVTSRGGASSRTCNVRSIGSVSCDYVNPAVAQGYNGWTSQSPLIPTPLTFPFYVFAANGREYRYWLRADTGYGSTIVASKPITANARTSLSWSLVNDASNGLCDVTTGRGACSPFGNVEAVVVQPGGSVNTAGWAIDPDGAASINIRVTVDGTVMATQLASLKRDDVGAAYPAFGPNHGFSTTVNGLSAGQHQVCVIAVDTVAPVIADTQVACRSVTVYLGSPIGSVDAIIPRSNGMQIKGWVLDPDVGTPIPTHVYLDGAGVANVPANAARTLDPAFAGWGPNHGFDITLDGIVAGQHTLCVYGYNVGLGASTLLSCQLVTVSDGSPVGAVESATVVDGKLRVTGWVIDPDTTGPIPAHLYVDGVGAANVSANVAHAPLPSPYTGWGSAHGFDITVPITPGAHAVCVYGFNLEAGASRVLGCPPVNVPSPTSGASPFGVVDVVASTLGGIAVSGWVIDPDVFGPAAVTMYVDGVGKLGMTAADVRADLGAVFPAWGPAHGFHATLGGIPAGNHTVCVYGYNTGPGASTLLACRVVSVSSNPIGHVDLLASPAPGAVRIAGWSADPDTFDPLPTHVYVDGVGAANVAAALPRSDVAAVYPAWGPNHGFDLTIVGLTSGSHSVCVHAFNAGPGSSTLLRCSTVTT